MVDTGIDAALASFAPCIGERPLLDAPSLSSTMRAAGGLSPFGVASWSKVLIESRLVSMASPIAVESWVSNLSMATLTRSRLMSGDTTTEAVPPDFTRPTLIRGGSRLTNSSAAVFAACSRLGNTSTAFIDSDTSMASITVPRAQRLAAGDDELHDVGEPVAVGA